MRIEKVDTLVVGGGQAGLAASEHLRNNGIDHLILERHRIAERWRTARWDSLVANGPAWHDRFPTMAFDDLDPCAFAPKERVARYFEDFARKIDAPIRCGVEVLEARRNDRRRGFHIKTSAGAIEANNIICATGAFQTPIIPPLVPADAGLAQLHSADYRNPGQLPEGAVLVVGAGSSGVQIADELMRFGRRVYLSVGPHERPPRSYRGRDFVWWLGVLGKWDPAAPTPGTEHVTIAVTGVNGGFTVDFRQMAAQGMTLVGMTKGFDDGIMRFATDLADNIRRGDRSYLAILAEADAYVARNGMALAEEREAHLIGADPECMAKPLLKLDLAQAGIASIVWATGFGRDYGWLKTDAFDENGAPKHQRGVSCEPGIYFLGLPWLSRRGSSFIWGVWHDAKYIADHIATQHRYLEHHTDMQQGLVRPEAKRTGT